MDEIYKDSKNQLEAWYREVTKANWSNSNQIKEQYRNALILGDNGVFFNIHENKYNKLFCKSCIYKVYWDS